MNEFVQKTWFFSIIWWKFVHFLHFLELKTFFVAKFDWSVLDFCGKFVITLHYESHQILTALLQTLQYAVCTTLEVNRCVFSNANKQHKTLPFQILYLTSNFQMMPVLVNFSTICVPRAIYSIPVYAQPFLIVFLALTVPI